MENDTKLKQTQVLLSYALDLLENMTVDDLHKTTGMDKKAIELRMEALGGFNQHKPQLGD